MATNRWQTATSARLSRRRALKAALGASAAGALLAACGGDSTKIDTNSLVAPYVDTSKRATRGGVMQTHMTRESLTFNPLVGTTADLTHAAHTYQRLLQPKVGTFDKPPDGSVEGQAAVSYELSPDRLQVTLKLRPGNKFDQRPPTNGRVLNAGDVKYSFDKFSALSPNRGNVLNSLNPDLPVTGVETPDNSTVVVKLAFPDSSILSILAWGWILNIVPVEAEDKFDTRQEMRGSGPWMLSEYKPSQGWSYRRNPNWYMANELPYLDGIDYALITESAVSEAQFKAKRLWSLTPAADNVVTLKREAPEALLYQTSPKEGNAGYRLSNFSKIPGNPFMDERVRHAVSMLIDRDLQNEVFGNVSGFQKEGIAIETGWHSHIPLSWSSLWQDPKTGKMGEGSQWFQHNPDEAAKLLRAAGKFGMETDFASWTPATQDQIRQIEVIRGFLEEGGHFKLNQKITDFNSHHYPNYFLTQQFEGIANYQTVSGLPDFTMVMWQSTNPGTRTSKIEKFEDYPGLKEVMLKSRLEVDANKKVELAREWARILAKYMPFVPYAWPGGAGTFTFAWPWYANFGVFRTYGTFTSQSDSLPRVWYDKSKDSRTG